MRAAQSSGHMKRAAFAVRRTPLAGPALKRAG
jgi:hypothetical protein